MIFIPHTTTLSDPAKSTAIEPTLRKPQHPTPPNTAVVDDAEDDFPETILTTMLPKMMPMIVYNAPTEEPTTGAITATAPTSHNAQPPIKSTADAKDDMEDDFPMMIQTMIPTKLTAANSSHQQPQTFPQFTSDIPADIEDNFPAMLPMTMTPTTTMIPTTVNDKRTTKTKLHPPTDPLPLPTPATTYHQRCNLLTSQMLWKTTLT